MKTLSLYAVVCETLSGRAWPLNVAARTKALAKRQVKSYSKTIRRISSVERIGNVNVPVNLPSGV